MAQATLPVSAFQLIRDYPLDKARHLWSAGKTIRSYKTEKEPLAPPWEDMEYHSFWCGTKNPSWAREPVMLCDAHKEELAHLIASSEPVEERDEATADTAVPTKDRTIEQELLLAGYKVKSLMTEADDGVQEANIAAHHTSITPYSTPSPLTMRRIEWEQRTKLSSKIIKIGITEVNKVPQVAIRGISLTPEQRVEQAKKYLAKLKRLYGELPTIEKIREFHAKFAELRKQGKKPNFATLFPEAAREWARANYAELDPDPTNDMATLEDQELHDVCEVLVEPDPDEIAEAEARGKRAKPTIRIALRNKPSSAKALGYNANDPLETPTKEELKAYYDTILPPFSTRKGGQTAIGTDNDMAMTEWDLGVEFHNEEPNNLYLPDLANPLDSLID